MDQFIELLKQIQELAGVGIEALKGAESGGEKKPEKGAPPAEGAPPRGPAAPPPPGS